MRLGLSSQVFLAAAAAGRKALVGYYPVGYPNVEASLQVLKTLCGTDEHPGVDLVEVGMPYSDPMMDGSVIQSAGSAALRAGVRTRDVFAAVQQVREAGKCAVVMTYWNLVERYGVRAFARDLANAGGAGVITVDLIPEEASQWFAAADEFGLDRIFLVSPSSSDERLVTTVQACRGWVYATAVMGVTGMRNTAPTLAPQLVSRIRELVPEALIGVGLGVSNGEQAASVAEYSDAVIVGSALLKPMIAAGSLAGLPDLQKVLDELVAGVRGGTATQNAISMIEREC